MALLFLWAPWCRAEDIPTVAIMPKFENTNAGHTALETGIPDLLIAALETRSDLVQVVERNKLTLILDEKSKQYEHFMDEPGGNPLHAAGKLVQARYIVQGVFTEQSSRRLRIHANLYDVETTQLINAFSAEGDSVSLNRLTDQLAGEIAIAIKTDGGRVLDIDPDPERGLFFTKGLGFYHQKQYPKAISEFAKILAKNPKDAHAKYWLIKTYEAAGMSDHARVEREEFLKLFPNDKRFQELQKETLP